MKKEILSPYRNEKIPVSLFISNVTLSTNIANNVTGIILYIILTVKVWNNPKFLGMNDLINLIKIST